MKKLWDKIKEYIAELKTEAVKLENFFIGHFLPVAVAITEDIKNALDSGQAGFYAQMITNLTGSGIPLEVVGLLKLVVPKLYSLELGITTLPINPTESDIEAWEQRCLAAWGITTFKSKVLSATAAMAIVEFKTLKNEAGGLTYASAVRLAEDTYQNYKKLEG